MTKCGSTWSLSLATDSESIVAIMEEFEYEHDDNDPLEYTTLKKYAEMNEVSRQERLQHQK